MVFGLILLKNCPLPPFKKKRGLKGATSQKLKIPFYKRDFP